jgi:hypothetical protein
MPKYLVEIPIVGYVSVVVEADNMEEASDRGFEVASFCQYKTDGQDPTLAIEYLEPVEDLVESLANSKCSLEMAKVIEL